MSAKDWLSFNTGERKSAMRSMTFNRSSPTGLTSWMLLPRTNRNYARDVGDGLRNSIVFSLVSWAAMNFCEAPLVIKKRTPPDKAFEILPDHEILELIENPNDFYTGQELWTATVFDWNIHGNAYWMKVRNIEDTVIQLWYVPQSLIMPVGNEKNFLSHYSYKPTSNTEIVVEPRDVIHFRNSLDPENPLKGLSQIRCLLREIFTDDEAANFSASLLTNMGVPGVIISPENMNGAFTTMEDDGARIKNEFSNRFGGDRRGEPLIFTSPTKIQVLSWSPENMNLKLLRRLPEERAAAVFKIHPAVVGLGAGLEHCLTGDALITTEQGPVEMKSVLVGMKVLSLVSNALEYQTISRQWSTGIQTVYEIKTATDSIRATANHPFLTRKPEYGAEKDGLDIIDESTEWKRLDQLQVGDWLTCYKENLSFSQIVSITAVGEEETFDVEVEGSHNFIANRLLVHNSSFSNYRDAREAAYQNNIIPTQRTFASIIKQQLLSDFEDDRRSFQVEFDLSHVKALAEDVTQVFNRWRVALGSGAVTVSEYRTAVGLEVDETHDIYLRAPSMIVVPLDKGADPDFMFNRKDPKLFPGTTNTSVPDSVVSTDPTPGDGDTSS